MPEYDFYVYVLANTFHHLYTGITNNIQTRVHDHKHPTDLKSFTARYNINRLVYYEHFQYVQSAIAREKQIKGWLRKKKIALIVEHNPTWRDLSEDWGKPIPPFDESKLKPPTTF
jgi:putative endonuclease